MRLAAWLRARGDCLEEQLRLRHHTMGCIFIAAVALPFVAVLFVMDLVALATPAIAALYDPALLPWMAVQEGVSLLFYTAVLGWCLPRRQSAQERPLLAMVLITYLLVASANLAVLYGHKDTPLGLVFLAGFVLARSWFPLRLMLPGLVGAALLVGGAELLIARGRLDYAPLLAEPMVNGRPLGPWWGTWLRVLYDMAVVFFASAMFFIFGTMERRHRELEELTRTDTLTGLPNRGTFMRLLEEEFAKQLRTRRAACVMMCDVDHFKAINDTHGHPVGDAVLAALGALLGDAVRQPIDVPARFGGEEFVVLLPETGLEDALRVAERLRARLAAQVFEGEDGPFRITLSIGIAEADDGNGERALRVADDNLYRAKREGRDRVIGSRVAADAA